MRRVKSRCEGRLEPPRLAVAMFVALPAAYGIATSLLGERFLRDGSAIMRSRPWPAALVFLLPIGLLGPAGIGLAIAALAVAFLGQRAPMLGTIWGSAPPAPRSRWGYGGPDRDSRAEEVGA